MLYLIVQMLFSLLVAAALGALAGWLAKGVLAARRDEVWRRELRHSEARAGNLKNQLAEASLVEDRLREELRGLEEAAPDAAPAGDPELIPQLQAELADRDQKIKLLQLQISQSEAALASEWQSLKAVKAEIAERQRRLEKCGKNMSGKLRASEQGQQQLRLQMRALKRQRDRLREELAAVQEALKNERRQAAERVFEPEAKPEAVAVEEPVVEEAVVEEAEPVEVPEPVKEPEPVEEPDDDLQQIRGIGKVLYRKLRQAGITSFRQIAGWTDDDLVEVASRIGSAPGRIRRDGWIESARKLL